MLKFIFTLESSYVYLSAAGDIPRKSIINVGKNNMERKECMKEKAQFFFHNVVNQEQLHWSQQLHWCEWEKSQLHCLKIAHATPGVQSQEL